MRASYQWIRDYLEGYEDTADAMAEALTFSGNEVEEVETVGEDQVLDIGVTSNRVDCLCHLGLAREMAALSGKKLLPPKSDVVRGDAKTADAIRLEVRDAGRCPRYTAQVIEGVKVGPSPDWLVTRLETLGLRSVNNVVDVTNFVLLEMNQPLHAFDLDRLAGPAIIVRGASAGEEFKALNDKSYVLDPEDLVIADENGPIALGGVMGGLDTEVGDGTTRVLLESANFNHVSVRRSSRRHGLMTDSSHRFERRVDRRGALEASNRAARLILELCGGTLRADPLDLGGDPDPREAITLRSSKVEAVCGITVPFETMASILESLDCQVERQDAALSVKPPSFRHDLAREIDLVEEIIRIHGLDEVPLESSMTVQIPRQSPLRRTKERVRDAMVGLGFCETVTPNFVPDGVPAETALLSRGAGLRVLNPVRSAEGGLRRSLLPSLLQVRKHNQDHGNSDCRFFELCNLHFARAKGDVPEHRLALGVLLDGDLRDIRGVAEEVGEILGVSLEFAAGAPEAFSEGATLKAGGSVLGYLGAPGDALISTYHLKQVPMLLELDLEALAAAGTPLRSHHDLPRFPASDRDLALVVDEALPFGELRSCVEGLSLSCLESLSFVDEYRGKQVGAGKKSLAIRLVFRSSDRTLTSEEVDAETAQVTSELASRFSAELRGGP